MIIPLTQLQDFLSFTCHPCDGNMMKTRFRMRTNFNRSFILRCQCAHDRWNYALGVITCCHHHVIVECRHRTPPEDITTTRGDCAARLPLIFPFSTLNPSCKQTQKLPIIPTPIMSSELQSALMSLRMNNYITRAVMFD